MAQFKPIPVFGSKTIPVHQYFSPKFPYKWLLQMVNAICLKMGHAFFLIGFVPGVSRLWENVVKLSSSLVD